MKHKLETIIEESHTYAECLRKLNWADGGSNRNKLKMLIEEYSINTSHFDPQYINKSRRKYIELKKVCPICDAEFITQTGPKEKITCSYSCSNTYFNGISRNLNVTRYRTICFRHHAKKCVVCGEDNIVEVHHLDHDRNNNVPSNLVPLCPTQHQYWHSRHRSKIENVILKYVSEFKLTDTQ